MLDAFKRLVGAARAASPPPTRGNVGVYQRGALLIIAVDDETDAGFWVATDRITTLPDTVAADALGGAIRAALAASRTAVPTPSFRGTPPLDAPLWRAAGVRSRRAFMSGTRFCSVHRDAEQVTITATANGGSTGADRGWRPVEAAARTLPVASDDTTFGAAVRAALADAQP